MDDAVAIPADISDALDMARKASHWMFASFFVGISFLLVSFLIGTSSSPASLPPPPY